MNGAIWNRVCTRIVLTKARQTVPFLQNVYRHTPVSLLKTDFTAKYKRRRLPLCTKLTITIKVTSHLSYFPVYEYAQFCILSFWMSPFRITFLFKNAVILERARLVAIKYLLDVRDHPTKHLMQELCGLVLGANKQNSISLFIEAYDKGQVLSSCSFMGVRIFECFWVAFLVIY